MQLEHYLTSDNILLFPKTAKKSFLDQLAGHLAAPLGIEPNILRTAVWNREALMSTGMGGGIGIPHVRLSEISRAAIAVGVCPAGVDEYESIDSTPVQIAVLIAAPAGEHELYIRLLARVAEVLRCADKREAILASTSSEEIYTLLLSEES